MDGSRRVGAVLLSALGVVTLLGGCSVQREAGAAAVVGDDRISIARLQRLTQELVSSGGTTDAQTGAALTAGQAQRQTLEKLIGGRLVSRAAADHQVSLSNGDVDSFIATLATRLNGRYPDVTTFVVKSRNVPPSYARQYIKDVLLTDKLETTLVPGDPTANQDQRTAALNQVLTSTAKHVGVDVNPRYGTWNARSGAIDALVSGGLANPAK